jgi:hypothetical protein
MGMLYELYQKVLDENRELKAKLAYYENIGVTKNETPTKSTEKTFIKPKTR